MQKIKADFDVMINNGETYYGTIRGMVDCSWTMIDGELAYTSFERALRIVTINRGYIARDGAMHPTQKPIALYGWILNNYAREGDKIFDPMMGSQSSRIAAYRLGFDYYGCELDKEYFDKGNERFRKETQQLKLF